MNSKSDFSSQTIANFLKELGSSAPSPGGGAGAALTGAIAASLLEMVTRINDARDKKKQIPFDFESVKKAEDIRNKFLKLMDDDTLVFLALSALPRESRDGTDYQNALKRCATVPFEMCQTALQGSQDSLREKKRVSRWLASDLVEAGVLFYAAFESARLNVEINLQGIKDDDYGQSIKSELGRMQKIIAGIKDELREAL